MRFELRDDDFVDGLVEQRARIGATAQAVGDATVGPLAERQVRELVRLEVAERDRQIAMVTARRESEAKAVGTLGSAEAEKKAAAARADAITTIAEAEATAEKLKAAAAETRYRIEAAGRKGLNEAENLQSDESMQLRVKLAVIEHLEGIIRESAKPLERIEGIKIVHLDGLGLGATPSVGPGTAAQTSLSDQVMSSALKYKIQAPLVESLLKDVGLTGLDAESVAKAIRERP